MTDIADVVFSQAIVCAYAVPVAGPLVAAGTSILQAVYNSTRSTDVPPGQYTAGQALADLGTKIGTELRARRVENELAVIKGWQLSLADAHETTPGYAVTGASAFLADHDFNKTFGEFLASEPRTEDRVKALGNSFLARITYHSLCNEWLDRLEAGRAFDPIKASTLTTEIRSRYLRSLRDGIEFARETVDALDDAYWHTRERATGRSDTPIDDLTAAMSVNLARAQQMRRIRRDELLTFATAAEIRRWQQYIVLFNTAIAVQQAIAHPIPQSAPAPKEAPAAPAELSAWRPVPASISSTTVVTFGPSSPAPVGPPPSGTARFRFESAPAGGWVGALDDSTVSPGLLVTQDAGSNDSAYYYRIDGGGLNGIVAGLLEKADQLVGANADLITAYDARWGAGAHAADSTAPSPQDRLTSFLVLLANGVAPIGESVCGVLYSVGPHLRDEGISDTDAYKQIYLDGLTAIADWNRGNDTPIVNLRLTLLSTGIYAGDSAGPELNAQAAGLIVDAVVEATRTVPELAALTLLVNTNDTAAGDGEERVAFEAAARARSITTTRQGFDVPLS